MSITKCRISNFHFFFSFVFWLTHLLIKKNQKFETSCFEANRKNNRPKNNHFSRTFLRDFVLEIERMCIFCIFFFSFLFWLNDVLLTLNVMYCFYLIVTLFSTNFYVYWTSGRNMQRKKKYDTMCVVEISFTTHNGLWWLLNNDEG